MFSKIYEKIKSFIIRNWKFLIFLVCFAVFLNYRLDYIIYTPGGYVNLNERFDIEDAYDTDGSFNMAYVSMVYATPATYLLSYIIPNWDLEDIDSITLEGQSLEDLEEYQTLNMKASLDLATIVAYTYAGEEITNIETVLNIMYIEPSADTNLEVGDVIIEFNGIENPVLEDLTSYLADKSVGDKIYITVLRDDKVIETTSTLIDLYDKAMIGISFIETFNYDITKSLEFNDKSGESGPSGGLMMTLSIYNHLVEDDLSNGLNIVGTGTIDISGNVGEIDGVKYKILGSEDADIFFCPVENYDEALEVIDEYDLDITLVKVETFYEAVEYLQNLN